MKINKSALQAEDSCTCTDQHYPAAIKEKRGGTSHGSSTGCATCQLPDTAARRMLRDLDNLVLRILARIARDVAQPPQDYTEKSVALADPAGHATKTSFHSADQPLGVLVAEEHNGGPHDQPTTQRPPSISHTRRARRHRHRILARQYRRPKERHEP